MNSNYATSGEVENVRYEAESHILPVSLDVELLLRLANTIEDAAWIITDLIDQLESHSCESDPEPMLTANARFFILQYYGAKEKR